MTIYRCPLWIPARLNGLKRVLHLASFAFSSLPVVIRQAEWIPNVIFTVAPNLLVAPGAMLAAKLCGADDWLHIQDFELDELFIENTFWRGKVYRLFRF